MTTEPKRAVVHGGHGGPSGTPEAKARGCICPGQVGDLDSKGRSGGWTILSTCPIHKEEVVFQKAEKWSRPKDAPAQLEILRQYLGKVRAEAVLSLAEGTPDEEEAAWAHFDNEYPPRSGADAKRLREGLRRILMHLAQVETLL